MKPTFHARLLNSPFEDPGLYIQSLREGKAFLFDLGFTMNLSVRDMLKVNDIFITHAHIDHFIGFDSILRLHLKREGPLRLYGPGGITGHIEGKLKSYTWNLIRDYPLVIEAHEVRKQELIRTIFRAENAFQREGSGPVPFQGIIMRGTFYRVSASVLDHRVPCLAFCLEEDYHINIDKAELNRRGLPVGPWLGEFKQALRQNLSDREFRIRNRTYSCDELKGIARITRGQKISYVVDIIGSDENVKKVVGFVRGSDTLFIEAYFLNKDRDRAMDRYHLTAQQAGSIAREAGVERMKVFHFSPKYREDPGELIREAEEAFRQ
jgi:ribonuclease Z